MPYPRQTLSEIAVQWDYLDTVISLNAPAFTDVFPADLRRVTLILQTQGPDAVLIGFRPLSNTQAGIFIWPSERPTVIDFRDYGPIVQQPVFATPFGTAGNATLQAFSVFKNG